MFRIGGFVSVCFPPHHHHCEVPQHHHLYAFIKPTEPQSNLNLRIVPIPRWSPRKTQGDAPTNNVISFFTGDVNVKTRPPISWAGYLAGFIAYLGFFSFRCFSVPTILQICYPRNHSYSLVFRLVLFLFISSFLPRNNSQVALSNVYVSRNTLETLEAKTSFQTFLRHHHPGDFEHFVHYIH